MRKLIGLLGLSAAALLSACGGGGGSSGNTAEQYSITLRADRTTLPLNISDIGPSTLSQVDAPYTTAVYVSAKEGNDPIVSTVQDGDFQCNLDAGAASGALYYLDGKTEHETDTGAKDANGTEINVPTPYSAIIIGANAGGATFYFHASDTAGTSHITCMVIDPRDNRAYTADVDITVGVVTGKPSSIQLIGLESDLQGDPLGVQGNFFNLRTSASLQAFVWDDANQPVPNPTAPNLQVSIVPVAGDNSWVGACLQAGTACRPGQNIQTIQVSTVGGVGTVSLSSGANPGSIRLQFIADRFDNDVSNGIQEPIIHYVNIPAVLGVASQALAFSSPGTLTVSSLPYSYGFAATGGSGSYTWSAAGLPSGWALSADGTLTITRANPGTYVIAVTVTDTFNATVTQNVTITVASSVLPTVASISITGTAGQTVTSAVVATGGTPPYTWTGALPAGLVITSSGVITGALPATAGTYSGVVTVTDSNGYTATGTVTVTVTAATP
jgi:hypothetical protein